MYIHTAVCSVRKVQFNDDHAVWSAMVLACIQVACGFRGSRVDASSPRRWRPMSACQRLQRFQVWGTPPVMSRLVRAWPLVVPEDGRLICVLPTELSSTKNPDEKGTSSRLDGCRGCSPYHATDYMYMYCNSISSTTKTHPDNLPSRAFPARPGLRVDDVDPRISRMAANILFGIRRFGLQVPQLCN